MEDLDWSNQMLEWALNDTRKLINSMKPIFSSLYELFSGEIEIADDRSNEVEEWLIKTYWEIIRKKAEFVSKDIKETKDDASNFTEAQEFLSIKEHVRSALGDVDSKDVWDRLEENQKEGGET